MTEIEAVGEAIRAELEEKNRLREAGLQAQREVIRAAANAIRAVHRGELERARQLLDTARSALAATSASLREHPDLRYAGWLQDAEKEYAEAATTVALLAGDPLPTPHSLGVGVVPYVNGLGEAVGELRRAILDLLRRGELGRSEELLETMDAIYSVLVTMDFPDTLTGGLRRTTDGVRALLERTRGDLTLAIRQARLEAKLASLLRCTD
ncbi:MAG: haloacid dehalogenase [Chloroflexota bacterium]|nr:haloacid dehalogenase [Dehalococcoidia bacterium]MDW8253083.1 haloacid dehalogenase [Chloroflexota bacterium]